MISLTTLPEVQACPEVDCGIRRLAIATDHGPEPFGPLYCGPLDELILAAILDRAAADPSLPPLTVVPVLVPDC